MTFDEHRGLEEQLRLLCAPDDPPCPQGERAEDLYAYASGSLRGEAHQRFLLHLATCATCRGDLDAFAAVDARRARGLRLFLGFGGALAAAALALVFIKPPDDELKPKGGLQVHVGVERGGERFRLPGRAVRIGDRLGLFYSSPTPGELTVVYVERNGASAQITSLFGPQQVSPGEELRLEAGAELGAPADCEWIVGAFELDAAQLTSAAEHASGCALDVESASVLRLER